MIVGGLLISLMEVLATLAFPLIVRRLVDDLGKRTFSLETMFETPLFMILFSVLVAGALAGGLSGYMLSLAGHRTARSLKNLLFGRLISRDVAFFDKSETGALVSRMTNDTQAIVALLSQGIAGLVGGAVLLLASTIVLFALDVALAAAILLIIFATLAIVAPIAGLLSGIAKRANDRYAGLAARLTRIFQQVKLVKAFRAEGQEERNISDNLDEVYEQNCKASLVRSALQPMTGLALSLSFLSIMIYGGARVENGSLTIGTLTAFILYIINLVAPLIQFSTFIAQYNEAKASADRIEPLLNTTLDQTVTGIAGPRPTGDDEGIVLKDLEFSYTDGEAEPTLYIPYLNARKGRALVISGKNGSGKSTLLSLILRFYKPQRGKIMFGGEDIQDLPISSWRSEIGYMFQDTQLMSGTIAENVAYGCERFDEERVRDALSRAGCDDFIAPGRLDIHDRVGEGGQALSGGQNQRIGLARIFYRDPEVVLLDEPTASLDPTNEAIIGRAINSLLKGRIVIVLSHRRLAIDPDKSDFLMLDGGRLRSQSS